MLSKKTALYDRDENGNLLPMEVLLEIDETNEEHKQYKGEKIKIIPIPRGKLKRLFVSVSSDKEEKDFDGEIIGEHCFEPKFEKEEIPHIKPLLSSIIVNTIFRESGLDTNKSRRRAMEEAEDDFAKN